MRAAFITGRESIQVRETDAPRPTAGEVLVRVRACGICGSDLHIYHGEFPPLPLPPGHEFAGEIAEVGEEVSGFTPGQRVVVEPLKGCRECTQCRTGQYQLCRARVLIGVFAPGGLAEFVSVPAYTLYPLPDAIDYELAALVEPLSVAVHGAHIVDLRMGERVLVLGSGTIGLMSIIVARAVGAREIVASSRHEHQAKAALAAGATRVVSADELPVLAPGQVPAPAKDSFDVVIETVGGSAPTMGQALAALREGGRISVLGLFTHMGELNGLAVMFKEPRIVGGFTYCRPGAQSDFEVALQILRSDPERARALITHRFPLEESAQAFATAADKRTKSLKVHVVSSP